MTGDKMVTAQQRVAKKRFDCKHQNMYNKCLCYKPHPKITWLTESGGSKLHDKNKNIVPLSLNYIPKTVILNINISTQK